MIKIVTDGNVYFPQVFCVHCGNPIESAKDGNVLWDLNEENAEPIGDAWVTTHKGCTRAFETETHRRDHWNQLDEWLVYLLRNLNTNLSARSSLSFEADND